jgi:hypothetical protein
MTEDPSNHLYSLTPMWRRNPVAAFDRTMEFLQAPWPAIVAEMAGVITE